MSAITPNELKAIKNLAVLIEGMMAGFSQNLRGIEVINQMVSDGLIKTKEQLAETGKVFTSSAVDNDKALKKYFVESLKVAEDVADEYIETLKLTKEEYELRKKLKEEDEKRFKKAKDLNSEVENLSDFLHDQYKVLLSQHKVDKDIAAILVDKVKSQSKFNKQFIVEQGLSEQIRSQLTDIDTAYNNLDGLSFDINGKVNLNSDDAVSEIERIQQTLVDKLNNESVLQLDKLKDFAMADTGVQTTLDSKLQNKKSGKILSGDAEATANKQIEDRVKLYRELSSYEDRLKLLSDERFKSLKANQQAEILLAQDGRSQIKIYSDQLNFQKESFITLTKVRTQLRAVKTAGDSAVDSMRQMAETLPKGLRYILQIDKSIDGVAASNAAAIKRFTTVLKDTNSIQKAVSEGFGTWGSRLSLSLTLSGGILLSLAAIFAITSNLEGKWKEVGKRLEISSLQAKKLLGINIETLTASHNQFSTMQDLLEIQQAYIKSTGFVGTLTTEQGQRMSEFMDVVSQAFSLTNETAVGALNTFMQVGDTMEDAQKRVMAVAKMAEAGGFAPELITKDLVENADIVATYYGGMAEEATKAAIQTRKMGMSLKQAGSVAKKMLNLEGFMTDMYELAAMGGPDLSKAFDLGLTGDLTGMTKEILNATGGLEQFNKLDYLTKQKMANTLGLSVDELSKSLVLEKQIAGWDKTLAQSVRDNRDTFSDIANISEKEAQDRLAGLESTKRLGVAWDKIKLTFIQALVPAVEAFQQILEGSQPIINAMVSIFKAISGVVGFIADIFKGIVTDVASLVKWLGIGSDTTHDVAAHASGISQNIDEATSGVSGFSTILQDIWKHSKGILGDLLKWGVELKLITKLGFGMFNMFSDTKAVAPTYTGMFKKVFQTIKEGFGGKSVVDQALGTPEEATKKASGISSIFSTMWSKIGSLATKGKDLIFKKSNTGTVADAGQSMASKIPGVGKLLPESVTDNTTMSGPSGGAETVGKTAEKSRGIVAKLTGAITTFMTEAKKWVSSARNMINNVMGIGVDLVKQAGRAFESVFDTITDVIGKIIDTAAGGIASLGKGLGAAFKGVLSGIAGGLNKFTPQSIAGAAAIGILSASVWVLSEAIQNLSTVSWEDLGKAGVMITGLGVAGAALGALSELILPGAVALGALGLAAIPLAAALAILSPVMDKFGGVMTAVFSGISTVIQTTLSGITDMFMVLSGANPLQISAVAGSLGLLSAAMLAFGGGSAIAGIGAAIGSFLGGDPLDKLEKIAELANPLDIAARAVKNLSVSIGELASEMDLFDFDRIERLGNLRVKTNSAPGTAYQKPIIDTKPAEPNALKTGQHVKIDHLAVAGMSREDMDNNQNLISKEYKFGGGKDTGKVELLLANILKAINMSNERPLVFQFDDGTIKYMNNRSKALNNNR